MDAVPKSSRDVAVVNVELVGIMIGVKVLDALPSPG